MASIAALAVLLRLLVRIEIGEGAFWSQGYAFYFTLAQNMADGRGLAFDGAPATMLRMPLYPALLALVTAGHQAFFTIVATQSIIGGLTVWCSALLAREWFGPTAAVAAAMLTALYPYYIVHDTALQETSLYTLLVAVSVLLLVKAQRSAALKVAALAGFVLGAAALTRPTILPFAAVVPLWVGWRWRGAGRSRFRAGLVCGAATLCALMPWLVRSYAIAGAPVIVSETGAQLWAGNNPYTFSRYPRESIDRSFSVATRALGAGERAELAALRPDEVAVDRWFLDRAYRFMREDPWRTFTNAWKKLAAAFSVLPSPRKTPFQNGVYLASYGFILALGVVGAAKSWRSWREHSIVYLLFLTFGVVTATFFGHTSHRAFLDVYLICFASSALIRFLPRHSEAEAEFGRGKATQA